MKSADTDRRYSPRSSTEPAPKLLATLHEGPSGTGKEVGKAASALPKDFPAFDASAVYIRQSTTEKEFADSKPKQNPDAKLVQLITTGSKSTFKCVAMAARCGLGWVDL